MLRYFRNLFAQNRDDTSLEEWNRVFEADSAYLEKSKNTRPAETDVGLGNSTPAT